PSVCPKNPCGVLVPLHLQVEPGEEKDEGEGEGVDDLDGNGVEQSLRAAENPVQEGATEPDEYARDEEARKNRVEVEIPRAVAVPETHRRSDCHQTGDDRRQQRDVGGVSERAHCLLVVEEAGDALERHRPAVPGGREACYREAYVLAGVEGE